MARASKQIGTTIVSPLGCEVGLPRTVIAGIAARSYHTNGANTLFMDVSVRFITNSIPQATWRVLGTRNGGEAVDANGY